MFLYLSMYVSMFLIVSVSMKMMFLLEVNLRVTAKAAPEQPLEKGQAVILVGEQWGEWGMGDG